jgi:predicted ABC-type ATPase
MAIAKPNVVVIAGPNGAGKSTIAPRVLRGTLQVSEFVNADVIARGLSAFEPENVAISAGRIMLTRLKELAAARESFAFETTLASRSFAPWIAGLRKEGYRFHLVYIWLRSPDIAVGRVAVRVQMGGHHVPEETIRRRYFGGLENFFELYRPITDTWRCYDRSAGPESILVATGRGTHYERIYERKTWKDISASRRKA